ncbi:DUF4232 domain-containing protein [Streptomyces sp. HSW2009]|uniref:DUF4232 domain-containing protein n=1 Tax=Streptomyces sp. HSW2009 TaxID=3142890 RepID=UPI0032EE0AC7
MNISALSHRTLRGAALAAVAVVTASAFGAGVASAAGSHGATATKTPTCTAANTKVTVEKLQRPINHLLITAKNTSKKSCNAYNYVFLQYGEAQSPAQVWGEKPQSVVTLKPGQSAYASTQPSSPADDGTDGYYTSKLGVYFNSANDQGSEGPGVTLNLPGGKTYVNDPHVTYWHDNVADAIY